MGPVGSIQNTEDKKVSRSGYHTNRISPNRSRSLDISPDLNLQQNGQPHGLNHWILHSQRKETSSCVRISEPSALLTILVGSLNRIQRQAEDINYFQTSRLALVQEGAPQSKHSFFGSSEHQHAFIDFKTSIDI